MNKKIIIAVFATVLALSAAFGVGYANGIISINVNGKKVSSDVNPRMVNNRVMVPISFVSKALGAVVSWDPKKQTVSIQSYGLLPENVWDENFDKNGRLSGISVSSINDTVQVFLAGLDTGNQELLKRTTSKEMDIKSLSGGHFSLGASFLSSRILDIKTIKRPTPETTPEYQVRVAIQTWLDGLTIDYLDLHVTMAPPVEKDGMITTGDKMEYIVTKQKLVKSIPVKEHRVFPGFSLK